jgi:hypothetical protein
VEYDNDINFKIVKTTAAKENTRKLHLNKKKTETKTKQSNQNSNKN